MHVTPGVYNVSGRCRTCGSDLDLQVWLPAPVYRLAMRLIPTGRIAFGSQFEMFINNSDDPDRIAVAALHNSRIQRGWDNDTFAAYSQAKAGIAHLNGKARKVAKATLAEQFGLNSVVYTYAL
jgi:hypothetical protein